MESLPVLKAEFACDIDSKISYKALKSGTFSNRNCGMKEVTVSTLAHIDEVDNLINGGLPLALKASKLYFRPVVPKHQKPSVIWMDFLFMLLKTAVSISICWVSSIPLSSTSPWGSLVFNNDRNVLWHPPKNQKMIAKIPGDIDTAGPGSTLSNNPI